MDSDAGFRTVSRGGVQFQGKRLYSRADVGLGVLLYQLSLGVHSEDPV